MSGLESSAKTKPSYEYPSRISQPASSGCHEETQGLRSPDGRDTVKNPPCVSVQSTSDAERGATSPMPSPRRTGLPAAAQAAATPARRTVKSFISAPWPRSP